MSNKNVVLKDISKSLGYSVTMVSRALRNDKGVDNDKREAIVKYARDIGYRPNPVALNLKQKRTKSIGIMIPEIDSRFFSQVVSGVESLAYEYGYNVVISQHHESFKKEITDLNALASRSVEGLLVSVASQTNNFEHFKQLQKDGLPIVFFDRVVDVISTHKVIANDELGSYKCIKHLLSQNYKCIGIISGSTNLSTTQKRISGYKKALLENGLFYDEATIISFDNNAKIESSLEYFFKKNVKLDAVFVTEDWLTIETFRFFKRKNIEIPQGIAVAGYSNDELTEYFGPALTTLKLPAYTMGEEAMMLLLSLIESEKLITNFETKILDIDVQIRQSTCT